MTLTVTSTRTSSHVPEPRHARGIIDTSVVVEVPSFGPVTVPFASVEGAKLVLTNKLISASKPLDMSDAEDFIETPDAINDNDLTED